jgi:hypothetical protein
VVSPGVESIPVALAVDPTFDEAITRMVRLQAVVRENRELLDVA